MILVIVIWIWKIINLVSFIYYRVIGKIWLWVVGERVLCESKIFIFNNIMVSLCKIFIEIFCIKEYNIINLYL